jgi:curli biogenesis system outer membrane secretion channel CsgG
MKKILFVFLSASLVSGCTSSTKEALNTPITTAKTEITTVDSTQFDGLKRLVAIGRFSDETKRGNSFLVDNNNNRLGKQATDILSSRLSASGKFIMLERPDVQLLSSESKNFETSKIGADYIIVGSVSEFGRRTESDVAIFSRNKIQIANATVNVRLIDVKTSRIVYSEEASGEARSEANQVFGVGQTAAYNTSLDDKAVSAAISKLVSNIMNNLLDSPWQAYLINSNDGSMFMTGGESQGIKLGQIFTVIEPGKQVKNPQTGMLISLPGKEVSTLKVTGFVGQGDDALSIVTTQTGKLDKTKIGQYVVREIKENNHE